MSEANEGFRGYVRPAATMKASAAPSIIYGRHPVMEGIEGRREIEKILLLQTTQPSEGLARIRRRAESLGIPVLFAPKEKLDRLSESRDHQGVVAILSSHEYASLNEIIESAIRTKGFVLALDHLEDPQNLGSLLRTSEAVGVSGIIIPKRRSAGLTPGAAKASAGAIHRVKTARVPNLYQSLLSMKAQGFSIIGASQESEEEYRNLEYPFPLVLVMGNEHKGLSFIIRKICDHFVKIPMQGKLNSLNVSVAGSLILYEIFFRRQSPAGENPPPKEV